MGHFLRGIVLLCLAGFAAPATAGDTFHGEWQQIASNAGECPSCRITIRQTGTSLQVTANNDWTAIAETSRRDTAGGAGFWKRGTRKTYSGKTFDIQFRRNAEDEDRADPREKPHDHRLVQAGRTAGNLIKVRSTTTDGELRSWVPTNVGGHRVTKPTGRVRDSSLWIEYGPRDCGSCREAQIASAI